MLVLTRKPGEEIVLPGLDVSIAVLAVRGCQVRLGIRAPKSTSVLRSEVTGVASRTPTVFKVPMPTA